MCIKIVYGEFRIRRYCKKKGVMGPNKLYCKQHAKYYCKNQQLKFKFLEEDQGLL